MIEKVCVGCKARVMAHKKYPWYEKMKYNILHQRYTSDTSDRAIKIERLRNLFGGNRINEQFKWTSTPEGYNYWSAVRIELNDNFPERECKFVEINSADLRISWKESNIF